MNSRHLGFASFALLLAAVGAPADERADAQSLLKTFRSEFVEITPGRGKFPASFVMGSPDGLESETPAHEVALATAFHIAKYEVPQNLYEAVMGENPSKWKGPRNSAENLTFGDATTFCRKVTDMLREQKLIEARQEIRLPTEAEWEYCCRAGTKTAYSFGDKATAKGDADKKASVLDAYGWHTGNAAGNDPPVGALKPNPWGLYDMHGYLWEFVSDPWRDSYKIAPTDQKADDPDVKRTIRGGSWKEQYEMLRSAARRSLAADAKSDDLGFRCVLASVP